MINSTAAPPSHQLKVQVLMLRQDDPGKCTAAKLVRFGLARDVKKTSGKTLVLDPFSARYLLPSDRSMASSITAIDCSWNLADDAFSRKFAGIGRRLPPLLAGNPVNYAKLNKLTTVEAISGALFVMGFREESVKLLDKFRWGHTFYALNQNLLEDYSGAELEDEIEEIASEYGLVS